MTDDAKTKVVNDAQEKLKSLSDFGDLDLKSEYEIIAEVWDAGVILGVKSTVVVLEGKSIDDIKVELERLRGDKE